MRVIGLGQRNRPFGVIDGLIEVGGDAGTLAA